jgi:uncharacterized membrane protein HdeD (DUF308 family)
LTDVVEKSLRKIGITISRPVLGIVAIIFGILFFIFPQLVSYLIGLFLIIEGILLLTDYFEIRHNSSSTTTSAHPSPPSPTWPPAPTPGPPPSPTKNENP